MWIQNTAKDSNGKRTQTGEWQIEEEDEEGERPWTLVQNFKALSTHKDGAGGLGEAIIDGRDAAPRQVRAQLHGAKGGVQPADQLAVGARQPGARAQVAPSRSRDTPKKRERMLAYFILSLIITLAFNSYKLWGRGGGGLFFILPYSLREGKM